MNDHALSRNASPAAGPAPLGRIASAALDRIRRLWTAWLRHRADAVAFRDVDAATLRDLGLARCEVASFRAEADGAAGRTRRRLAIDGAAASEGRRPPRAC